MKHERLNQYLLDPFPFPGYGESTGGQRKHTAHLFSRYTRPKDLHTDITLRYTR